MKIRKADIIIDKTDFSTEVDFDTYPRAIYECDICCKKIGFAIKHLDKHRFKTFSNLNKNDQLKMDKAILSLLPNSKIGTNRQIGVLSFEDIEQIKKQRQELKLEGFDINFIDLSSKEEFAADSFIDFYCPSCNRPIRIYYSSWLGGKCDHGYKIMYIID